MEDLLGARLEDLGQDAPRHHPRLAAADAGDLHRLVLVDHARQRAAALALDLLRVGHRRAQADRDVVGEVIAADADDRGVPEAAALVDRDVGRAAADVDERDAQLLLVVGQHRLRWRRAARPRVSATLTPARLTQATMFCVELWLPVTMWTFTSSRAPVMPTGAPMPSCSSTTKSCGSTWRISRPVGSDTALAASMARAHVLARDLAVLAGDGDHAAAVEALDVRARQRQVHRVDLDAGHQLGLFDRLLDRVDRRLEVDDDAAPDAARLGDAEADDVEAVAVRASRRRPPSPSTCRRRGPTKISFFARHSPSALSPAGR